MAEAVTVRNGAEQRTTYGYDAFGRRSWKQDAFGVTTFVWDGNRLLSETRGGRSHLWIYEDDSFAPLAQISLHRGDTEHDAEVYWYHERTKFMVTTSDVKKIISSDAYMELLSQTVSSSNIVINKSDPPSQVLNLEAGRINHSGIEIIDLESTILSDSVDIARFSVLKLTCLTDDDIDDYNEDSDEDLIIETLPFYKSFLIGYVLEYYFLKNNSAKLEGYLKKTRIPNYKDYTSELKVFYSKL